MKISIVIPAFNAGQFLAATLDSVLAQTVTDWELLVVDDGSVDNTDAIATAYADRDPRVRVLSKVNGGVATARHHGYERSDPESEFLIFLDHDDVWKPDALQTLVTALESDPDAVAAHGMARRTDLQGNPVGAPDGAILNWERRKVEGRCIVTCARGEPTTFATLICDCCIATPGVALIRRDAMENIQKSDGITFDQSTASADDWDVWLRLVQLGDFVYVDDALLDWRQHTANGSNDRVAAFAAELKMRRKMAHCSALSPEQRAVAGWRCRRVFASVERRNTAVCWRWACAAARDGKFRSSTAFLRACGQRFVNYLTLRLFLQAGEQHLPPSRLIDSSQVLET